MMQSASITIPVVFINEAPIRALAVDDSGLLKLLGYADKSPAAARQASWRFRSKFNIRTLPGGVYSIAEIQNALRASTVRRRVS